MSAIWTETYRKIGCKATILASCNQDQGASGKQETWGGVQGEETHKQEEELSKMRYELNKVKQQLRGYA